MSLIATDIMTSKVITAHPDDTVAKIAAILFDHGISAVPVSAMHTFAACSAQASR